MAASETTRFGALARLPASSGDPGADVIALETNRSPDGERDLLTGRPLGRQESGRPSGKGLRRPRARLGLGHAAAEPRTRPGGTEEL